jgi:hypothetical protein
MSDPCEQLTGFREGCCTSPILYNLFHAWPLLDFNQKRKDFVEICTLPGKPFNTRMKKQLRKKDNMQKHNLSLVSLADDTTLLARGHHFVELENLLCQTLADWKETVKPQKTQRLMIGRSGRELDHSFADSAKLLGSWFQDTGSYQLEDDKRLERARAVWRSL